MREWEYSRFRCEGGYMINWEMVEGGSTAEIPKVSGFPWSNHDDALLAAS